MEKKSANGYVWIFYATFSVCIGFFWSPMLCGIVATTFSCAWLRYNYIAWIPFIGGGILLFANLIETCNF